MLTIINQVFELEQKLLGKSEVNIGRNFKRLYFEFDALGYQIIDPSNRVYKETDSDIEATILGDYRDEMQITRVMKPIIYQKLDNGKLTLLQKAIVVVQ